MCRCDDEFDVTFGTGSSFRVLFAWRGLSMKHLSWLFLRLKISCISMLTLSGCVATFTPPAVDLVRFTPVESNKRNIVEPKVKYLVRADGYEYCARITGLPVTPTSRPMACAFWNTKRKECSIVTPVETGFNYLGHELRHCFEGAFHD